MAFVSASELEAVRLARKEQQREMRAEILREAKESFENEKRREELKRARGEDTWIVPAVRKRLGFKGESTAPVPKKKKKKKEKHKKHKKTEKERGESDSGGSEGEGEEMWVEKGTTSSPATVPATVSETSDVGVLEQTAGPPAKLQRDEWMTLPLGASDSALSVMSERQRATKDKLTEKEEAKFLDNPGQHPRELNPYWRDGGTGIPVTEKESESNRSSDSTGNQQRPKSSSSSSNRQTLGDGGHSWLLRAYKRLLEQAKDTGRSVEEIATNRWGSLEKFYSLLRGAGIDPENPDAPPRGHRGRGGREYLYSRATRLNEDRERRSVDEFDRRRDRDKRERGSGEKEGDGGRHGEHEWDRRIGGITREDGEREGGGGRHGEHEWDRRRGGRTREDGEREGGGERHGEHEWDRRRGGRTREDGKREGGGGRHGEHEWDRRRGGRTREDGEREGGGGRHGEHEWDRRRGGRTREDGEEGSGGGEKPAREGYRRRESSIEERKKYWKEGFRKSESSARDSGFLKPGDLDLGHHSSSTGMGAGIGGNYSRAGQGWRKKQLSVAADTALQTDKLGDSAQPDRSSVSPQPEGVLEPPTVAVLQDDGTRQPPVVAIAEEAVTEAQLNALGAKLLKAELVGNSAKVDKLKKELNRLREVKRLQESTKSAPTTVPIKEERTLVLAKTDRFGREKPVQLPSTSLGNRPPHSKAPTHSKKGKREKYFHDDDRYSLKELVEQERMMTAEETHAAIARMASKFVPAAGTEETVDDLVESKTAMKYNEAKELDKAKKRTMMESRKMADAIDKCQMCFDSQNFNKQLLIAVGMNTYLCAPWHTSLTEGHCYIVPMEHVTCSLYLDENVWSEVEIFRKGLTRMFTDRDMDVVFMETYTSVKRKTHMFIDCIPLPQSEGELAPMYFKKAILESDEEWAQNKKLIDTKEKGVRGSLPAGLPYFFAEFGLDGGFGHVIEDQDQFPGYFGREVVGGLLDLTPRLWLKPRREDFDKQKAKVLQLSEWWAPYDWTQKLKD